MTVLRKQDGMTVAQFHDWQPDRHPDRRWQLVDGIPVCMAPASENHGSIQAEAAFLLTAHLRSSRPGCRVVVAPGVVPRISAGTNERVPDSRPATRFQERPSFLKKRSKKLLDI